MEEKIETLLKKFSFFETWEEKYTYLIELGKKLPPMAPTLKTDRYKVSGCISQVWIVLHEENKKLFFEADSDAHIVRGLIYVLREIFLGISFEQALTIDIPRFFQEIGFDDALSPTRSNGFFSMVNHIQSFCKQK